MISEKKINHLRKDAKVTQKPQIVGIMKTEQEKKEIEAIERELHQDGQQIRTAVDPSKQYK